VWRYLVPVAEGLWGTRGTILLVLFSATCGGTWYQSLKAYGGLEAQLFLFFFPQSVEVPGTSRVWGTRGTILLVLFSATCGSTWYQSLKAYGGLEGQLYLFFSPQLVEVPGTSCFI